MGFLHVHSSKVLVPERVLDDLKMNEQTTTTKKSCFIWKKIGKF